MRHFIPRPRSKSVPNRRPARLALTELEARCTPASFVGVNLQDLVNHGVSAEPPDTMGAIGPNYFVEPVNEAIAIYDRSTGAQVSYQSIDSFFTFTSGGTTFPRGGTSDPRILYDQHSGHWFASILELGTSGVDNDIMLAVSQTSDPTGVWNKYDIPMGVSTNNSFTDFDTLGVDDNGVYFGANIFPSGAGSYAKIAATPKAPLIAATPSLGTVYTFSNITDMEASPQPVTNLDSITATAPAFFVASSNTANGNVNYKTLTWGSGGVPTLSTTQVVTTPTYAGLPPDAPQSGSTTLIATGDDRISGEAVIRNHQLWTARTVGVDVTGAGVVADRAAVEWIDLNAITTTLSLNQTGRIFDNAAANPRYYYYPSVAVTGQGNVRIGFSGSKATEFAAGYSAGRLATDLGGTMSAPALVKAGERAYNGSRWGDYSATSTDPNDNMTAWTIQEYASNVTPSNSRWGTWIQTLAAPAPTLNNPNGSGTQGQTSVTLNLTGTKFYDPGVGFPDHLQVQLNGGTVNGISNIVTTFNNQASATVTFDIAGNATPGPRDIVLTNPDGQSVTVTGGFTVNSAAVPVTLAGVQVNDGSAQRSEVRSLQVTFSGPVTFAGGNAAAAFQLLHVQTNTNIANMNAAVSINGSGATVVTLTFTTSGNAAADIDPVSAQNPQNLSPAPLASLADGRYQLTIFSADVTGNGLALDGDNNGTAGGDYVTPAETGPSPTGIHLYRLFGDATGDGLNDLSDLAAFRNTYNAGTGNPAYVSYLDADNSGVVDLTDLAEYRNRYNHSAFV
jgi:hypothetical protein